MTDASATCGHNDHNKGPGHCTICHPGFVTPKAIEKGRTFNHRDGIAELRRFEMETKAREIAEWIAVDTNEWYDKETNLVIKRLTTKIAAALEAEFSRGMSYRELYFAKELEAERKAGREEALADHRRIMSCEDKISYWEQKHQTADAEGYRRGMEEAAGITEVCEARNPTQDCHLEIAERIREKIK